MWYNWVELERLLVVKKLLFILLDDLSLAVYFLTSRILMSFSEDETLLPRLESLSSNFREPQFSVEMPPFWLKLMYSVLSSLTYMPMLPAACTRLYSWDSAWVGVFARSAMSFAWSASAIVCTRYRLLMAYICLYIERERERQTDRQTDRVSDGKAIQVGEIYLEVKSVLLNHHLEHE